MTEGPKRCLNCGYPLDERGQCEEKCYDVIDGDPYDGSFDDLDPEDDIVDFGA